MKPWYRRLYIQIGALGLFGILLVAYLWPNSYLRIMTERQIQSLSTCTFGTNKFTSPEYGFSLTVQPDLCILPARLYPRDGILEVLPKGFYFVFNEYAKGTVAQATQAIVLIEPTTEERSPEKVIANLLKGSFADAQNISTQTSAQGIEYTQIDTVLGVDGVHYDWAIFSRPDGKYFFAILTKHSTDKNLFTGVINTFTFQ